MTYTHLANKNIFNSAYTDSSMKNGMGSSVSMPMANPSPAAGSRKNSDKPMQMSHFTMSNFHKGSVHTTNSGEVTTMPTSNTMSHTSGRIPVVAKDPTTNKPTVYYTPQ